MASWNLPRSTRLSSHGLTVKASADLLPLKSGTGESPPSGAIYLMLTVSFSGPPGPHAHHVGVVPNSESPTGIVVVRVLDRNVGLRWPSSKTHADQLIV